MICENCWKIHNGSYGSGRFCDQKCARAFSTKNKRKEINQKVSNTIKNNHKGKTKLDLKIKKKQDLINDLLNNGYTYIKYSEIDFGSNYLINKNGIIYSLYTMKELKHSAYNGDGNWYRRIILKDINKHKHLLYLHRILAETFIPNPNNYPCINHKDENKTNNCVDNLEWCTIQYNNTYNNIHKRRKRHIPV